jgi:uncharacterized membrane protein
MPFCNQCGTPVQSTDRYCGKCGAAQPMASPGHPDFVSGMSPRTASLLCYIPWVGWIAAIVVLASARFRHDHEVRFNAFQGLYLFVAWLLVDWVLSPPMHWGFGPFFLVRAVPELLKLGVLCVWIFMIIKAAQGQSYRLPILGELAERSLTEQR